MKRFAIFFVCFTAMVSLIVVSCSNDIPHPVDYTFYLCKDAEGRVKFSPADQANAGDSVAVFAFIKEYERCESVRLTVKNKAGVITVDAMQNAPFQINLVPLCKIIGNTVGADSMTATALYKNNGQKRLAYTLQYNGVPPAIKNGRVIQCSTKPVLNQPLTMSITVKGTPPFSYQWYKGIQWDTLPNSNKSQITFEKLKNEDSNTYRCVVANTYGSDTSLAFDLQVGGPNTAPVLGNNKIITVTGNNVLDSSLTLSVLLTDGTLPIRYFWYKDSLVVSKLEKISFPRLKQSDSGTYWCMVQNNYGGDTSRPYKLTIVDNPVQSPKILNDKAILSYGKCMADSLFGLYVVATGKKPLLYMWKKNGLDIPGQYRDTLRFTPLKPSDSAVYTCMVLNDLGSDTSKPYDLKVGAISRPPVWTKQNYTCTAPANKFFYFSLSDSCKDPDNDPLVFDVTPKKLKEAAIIIQNNLLTCLPKDIDADTYVLTLTASDGKNVGTAILILTVPKTNNRPEFIKDLPKPLYQINEGDPLSILFLAQDPDNNHVFYHLIQNTLPQNGNPVTFDTVKRELSWLSKINDKGTYKIGITATDNLLTDTAAIAVVIGSTNVPPVIKVTGDGKPISPDDTVSIEENKTVTLNIVASDTNGDRLTLSASNLPPPAQYTVNGNEAVFKYTPDYTVSSVRKDSIFRGVTFIAEETANPVFKTLFKIKIRVKNVNREPQCQNITKNDLKEKVPYWIKIPATDPDKDELAWRLKKSDLRFGNVDKEDGYIVGGSGFDFRYISKEISKIEVETFSIEISDGVAKKNISCVLTILPEVTPPKITEQPKDVTVADGETATFRIVVQPEPGVQFAYAWRRSDNPDQILETKSVYSFTATQAMNDKSFECVVTNTGNTLKTTSSKARLTVKPPHP